MSPTGAASGRTHLRARLLLLGTALLFSTGGAGIKAVAFTGWQVASLRSGVAALAMLAFLPEARRGWTRGTLLVAVNYAATVVLYVMSNRLTTAANSIFLQSTAPLYILLLGPWLLHEPMRRRDVPYLLVVGAGLSMFFLGQPAAAVTAPAPMEGNLLALGSGVGWGLTLIGMRWLGRNPVPGTNPAMAAATLGNLLAFAVVLPLALPIAAVGAADWGILIFLGVFQIGAAYVLLARAMPHVSALEAALFLLPEPVLNPIWAWLVHGEQPGGWAIAGGAIILTATTLRTVRDARGTG